MPLVLLLGLLLIGSTPDSAALPQAARLRADLTYLASDELEGRLSGTPGCQKAAGYIAAEMAAAGLSPGARDGTWYEPFDFVSKVSLAQGNALRSESHGLMSSYTVNTDYTPLFFSADGEAHAPVAFAGYSITAPEYLYDDYEGIDVEGKIVLALLHEPGVDDENSVFAGRRMTFYSELRTKAIAAHRAGASALVLVRGPLSPGGKEDLLPILGQGDTYGTAAIPVLQMTRAAADGLLAASGTTIAQLQELIDADTAPSSFLVESTSLALTVALERIESASENVVGVLPQTVPTLVPETIVVGAHYDHLGYGPHGSLYTGEEPAIHNGADDNASGVAGVLELARLLASEEQRMRNVVFVAFSGEELGLLGSSAFVKEGPLAVEEIKAMINMDMIGRLNDTGALVVSGVGSAVEWDEALTGASGDLPLDLKRDATSIGPSDHTSFAGKSIPVLHFFTGVHDDYHKPSDDTQRINFEGEVSVLTLIARLLADLATGGLNPTFQPWSESSDSSAAKVDTQRGFNVYMGTIPDYAISDKLVLAGVKEGGPAWRAGLRAGDQITVFGEMAIANVYDYTYALQTYQPGDAITIQVRRGDSILIVPIVLEGMAAKRELEGEGEAENPHGEAPHGEHPQGDGEAHG